MPPPLRACRAEQRLWLVCRGFASSIQSVLLKPSPFCRNPGGFQQPVNQQEPLAHRRESTNSGFQPLRAGCRVLLVRARRQFLAAATGESCHRCSCSTVPLVRTMRPLRMFSLKVSGEEIDPKRQVVLFEGFPKLGHRIFLRGASKDHQIQIRPGCGFHGPGERSVWSCWAPREYPVPLSGAVIRYYNQHHIGELIEVVNEYQIFRRRRADDRFEGQSG